MRRTLDDYGKLYNELAKSTSELYRMRDFEMTPEDRRLVVASSALTGLLARSNRSLETIVEERKRYAEASVSLADAMLDKLHKDASHEVRS